MSRSKRLPIYAINAALVAALGGFLFGFDTAVISGTIDELQAAYMLNDFSLGFTVAVALIGTIIGALTLGKPADIFGRKPILFAIAIIYFISAIGSAFAWNWPSFLIFRFIGGIGVGGASVVSPLYIAEISPAKLRGRLVALTQINIVLGILLAFVSNFIITYIDFGMLNWRIMLGVEAAPSLLFFLLLFLVPRSPRWLVINKREDQARHILQKLGTDGDSIKHEIAAITQSLDLSHHSLREPFFQKRYAFPITLAVAIAMFNQLSGINAVLYYAPYIFKLAGAGEDAALLQAVAIGLVNLIFTMLAMLIIDLLGRRSLMLIGSVGYLVSLIPIAFCFYYFGDNFSRVGDFVLLISLFLFIASHAFGQGAVIWVFISEIFPNRIRARGQSLGSFTHWVMAALISWTFPVIAESSGAYAFTFYAMMMLLQLLWVIFIMPETKGVPLEKIQQTLGIK